MQGKVVFCAGFGGQFWPRGLVQIGWPTPCLLEIVAEKMIAVVVVAAVVVAIVVAVAVVVVIAVVVAVAIVTVQC